MQKVTIGFLGCGNIGSGVWKLISDFRYEFAHRHQLEITVKKILVRDVTKPRGFSLPEGVLTDRAEDVLEDSEIQIVMEFLGGEYPATSYILQALHNGKTVVTANKVALALHWHELQAEAVRQQVGLYYEASVCGAIPVIDVLQHSLGANRIDKLYGIINGTTNYILSRMAETGLPYEQVLQEAQQLGLAEPDPASDVEGLDAAYKLSIMASLAFHGRVTFPKVYREGITRVTDQDIAFGREMGLVLKLLAIAKRTGNQVEVRVHPTFLPKSHPLARVDGSFNAVYLHGHACQEMMLRQKTAEFCCQQSPVSLQGIMDFKMPGVVLIHGAHKILEKGQPCQGGLAALKRERHRPVGVGERAAHERGHGVCVHHAVALHGAAVGHVGVEAVAAAHAARGGYGLDHHAERRHGLRLLELAVWFDYNIIEAGLSRTGRDFGRFAWENARMQNVGKTRGGLAPLSVDGKAR